MPTVAKINKRGHRLQSYAFINWESHILKSYQHSFPTDIFWVLPEGEKNKGVKLQNLTQKQKF